MPDPSSRIRLVVLFGGVSAEHEVSCVTASHVLRAVDPERYDLVPVGITKDGEWQLSDSTVAALASGPDALPESLVPGGTGLQPMPTVAPQHPGQQVVVLPLMHGPFGEDGTVQGLLELADVPYVGAGVLGSAVCMDKGMAKVATAAAGIPQGKYLVARDVEVDDAFYERIEAELGLPAFVKPANLGSSVGITKAHDRAELVAAIATALAYDEFVVVEETITGREIEVAVLGNAEPRASVPGEIRPSREFYDYEDKYTDGAAELLIPAPLSPEHTAEVQALALAAFKALRVDGMARVDFFFEEDGRGFLLNEVNTLPGFTPISMYPSLWGASGVAYPDLVDELVRLAIERHDHRKGHGRPH